MKIRYRRPEILTRMPDEGHIVIEASAGTGKTYALEHLVVDLILREQMSISDLLVVTFTERATGELKQRIRALLETIHSAKESNATADEAHWVIDDETRLWLNRQIDAFGRASIFTIHGFCHRILSENAFHLRRLFDEERIETLSVLDRAFTRALREEIAVDAELRSYLEAWLKTGTLRRIKGDVTRAIRQRGRIEPRLLEDALRMRLDYIADNDPDHVLQAFEQMIHNQVSDNWQRGRIGDCAKTIVDAARDYADTEDLAEFLRRTDDVLPSLIRRRRYDNLLELLKTLQPRTKEAHALLGVFPRLVQLRPAVIQKFVPIVHDYLEEEKARGFFDYDEMLQGVWERIANPDDPAARVLIEFLRDKYKVALIDEFQDTDDLQWNIFRRVFYEAPGDRNRLVVIGDPKQAIYGFRGADVQTYLDAREEMLGADGEAVRLVKNYRSTPKLIEAYNRIFDQHAREPFFTGDIDYAHPVSAGRPEQTAHFVEGDEPVPPVNLIEVMPPDEGLDAYTLKHTVARFMADRIRRILDRGVVIDNEELEEPRETTEDEIYVLTRSKREAELVGQYLRKAGVRYAFFKQQGLFETREAHHILDLLTAVADPHVQSKRFKAWVTPFFGVPLDRVADCEDLAETHPLMSALLEWHEAAGRHEFERLFADILERSGLIRREVFEKDSERELTNYMHIFEILLDEVHREQLDIADVVLRLRDLIDESSMAENDERHIQRLESEKNAVQVMTIHKSKGLEADVVFVFGGFSANPRRFEITHCHNDDDRILYLGTPQTNEADAAIRKEMNEEDERLLYVAVTRARAAVFLPYIAHEDGEPIYTRLNGSYGKLNDRLAAIAPTVDRDDTSHFKVFKAYVNEWLDSMMHTERQGTPVPWEMPDAAFDEDDIGAELEPLRNRPLLVSSYSRMKRTSGKSQAIQPVEFMTDVSTRGEEWRESGELPGGTAAGIFLHDVLEELDFEPLRDDLDFETWRTRDDVRGLFDASMRQHGIEAEYREYSERLVHRTLATPLHLPDGETMRRLAIAERDLREVEFLFPIPEEDHAALDELPDDDFEIRRGYIKGYIDLLFEYDGKIYFADWKSDSLEEFGDEQLEAHVTRHYMTQAMLYSLAVMRMFGLHSRDAFETRFGGYMYAFLRGVDGEPGRGFFLRRPEFDDLTAYYESLIGAEFE